MNAQKNRKMIKIVKTHNNHQKLVIKYTKTI